MRGLSIITKFRLASSLLLIRLIANILPVLAVDYNIGVSVGQYVNYGNFVGIGPGLELFNENDWIRIECTEISGKEVTVRTTGRLKNGVVIPGNGNTSTWNVETGTQDGSPSVLGPIIAANLTEGDAVPPLGTYSISKTETRNYLGVSRSVGIISSTISTPDYTTVLTFVYDKASGLLLEAESETTTHSQPPETSKYSYSVTETNVFNSITWGAPVVYLLVAAIVIIVAVVAAIALKKRGLKQTSVLNK